MPHGIEYRKANFLNGKNYPDCSVSEWKRHAGSYGAARKILYIKKGKKERREIHEEK